MNVLIIGGGGREHALAFALAGSPRLTRLFCAPGNAGIAEQARCVDLPVHSAPQIIAFCRREDVALVVIGPEQPLAAGLADALEAAGIAAFGPAAAAARLESSKGFARDLCAEAGVPQPAYRRFDALEEARSFVQERPAGPLVVKADGLAAGKGVAVAQTPDEAGQALADIFAGTFGPQTGVVIEEALEGEEASFFALCDGKTALPLASAQDHKRIGEGDAGPNTGGMGAYSPASVITPALEARIMDEIIHPALRALQARGIVFRGILYAGLMITARGPKLIEFNVRFGDPECQVLMMRLADDLLDLLLAARAGRLAGRNIAWRAQAALSVVMAQKGYPGAYQKGVAIDGLDQAAACPDVRIFHAGTARRGEKIVTAGGRVLAITALGDTIAQAREAAYRAVGEIRWPQAVFRRDIGWRALDREGKP